MKSKKTLVYFCLIMSMVFWGISFVGTKFSLATLNPMTLIFFRLVISSIFLFSLMAVTKKFSVIQKGDFKWFLLLSIFEPFFYFVGETYGIDEVSPTLASVIISTIPLFVPIAAFLLYRERIGILTLIGLFLSIIGVAMIIIEPDLSIAASTSGILFLFLAVLSAIGYTMIINKLSEKYSPLAIITWENFIGIFFFLPLFLFNIDDFINSPISLSLAMVVIALGIFPSSLSYMFFTYGVKELGVNKASVFTNAIPAITAIFSFIVLGEEMIWLKVTGIFVVTFALSISQMNYHKIRKYLSK